MKSMVMINRWLVTNKSDYFSLP